jgi:hypothetical protein
LERRDCRWPSAGRKFRHLATQGVAHVISRSGFIASLLGASLITFAPAALADDPVKDIVDHEIPALKDGTRIANADVEKALLAALARRKFTAAVESPGLIAARYEFGSHSFDVSIPFTDSVYSVRYKDSKRMDYNPARNRIDDSYNEFVAALDEHIQAQFEIALKRMKVAQKEAKKAGKVAAN